MYYNKSRIWKQFYASIKYKQAEHLQDQICTEYTGIVSGVTEWGMYVEIEENKC